MDTTPPSLAVLFRYPPQAPHEALGSNTAGLLCTSGTHRAGGHCLVSPGPIRYRGRCRRRPRPYPQGGRRPDGQATAFGKSTYNCHPAPDKSVGCTSASLKADAQDEPMDTTPPSMAIIFRSPLVPHEAAGSATFGPRVGHDAEDEPMDTTPPSMAVIFRSPLAPHSATFGLRAGHDAEDEPMDTTPPSMAIIFRSPPAPHSATFSPRAGHDAEDEPMDTTPPSMAVIFRSPPAPHEAAGSNTAGLVCTPDTRRVGSHRLVSPGPIRCRGRHRRRPRPYP
ncbi:uncharacterized protein [Manis javanica]|uniref:uncharacterized protein n=1 Tax=Manis javanica TaxID=9974 RepID=UPI003C6CE369